MKRIEKTVFISYRRTNAPWALAISQNLKNHGYDVFFDFQGIDSGDFAQVILENVRARAHFIVLLTPSALETCHEPGDWLRQEIETALETKRNIVPLMLEGFDFSTPSIAGHLTDTLARLKSYNALRVPTDYFDEAMGRLRQRYLDIELEAVLHPASAVAQKAAKVSQAAASAAPAVTPEQLTAQDWYERGVNATDPDEEIRCYTEAIRLDPSHANAHNNRGFARHQKGDIDGALLDSEEAIRLDPALAYAYVNRGLARRAKGDFEGGLMDYSEAVRLDPGNSTAYYNRGIARKAKGDLDGAMADYDQAIRLKPDYANAYYNRGNARKANGDLDGAMADYDQAIRLKPDFAIAFKNRGLAHEAKGHVELTLADFQKYLDLGGGVENGDQTVVEDHIKRLKKK